MLEGFTHCEEVTSTVKILSEHAIEPHFMHFVALLNSCTQEVKKVSRVDAFLYNLTQRFCVFRQHLIFNELISKF